MSYPLHGGTPTHHPFYLWNNIAVRTIKILTNPWLRRPFRHHKVPWDTVIVKCFNMVKNLTQKFIIIVTWIMDFLENLPEISIWTLVTFAFNSLIHEGGICFDFRNVHFDDVTAVESFLVVRRQIRQSCYILGTKHYCSNHYQMNYRQLLFGIRIYFLKCSMNVNNQCKKSFSKRTVIFKSVSSSTEHQSWKDFSKFLQLAKSFTLINKRFKC